MTSRVKKKINSCLAFKKCRYIYLRLFLNNGDMLNAYDIHSFKCYTCDLHPTGWRPCWILPICPPHCANL